MQENEVGPLAKRAAADAIKERATLELRKLLKELARIIETRQQSQD